MLETDRIIHSDSLQALQTMPSDSVHCCVTSPPYYGLRDYGVAGQIGRESTPERYIESLAAVFHEVWRVLRTDGTLWLNISDSYCGTGNKAHCLDPKYPNGRTGQRVALNNKVQGCKSKDLIGIPWLLAFALRNDGWYLRNDIIWEKGNPVPESVKDRCTRSYEHIFLLAKSKSYYYNASAIAEPVADLTSARRKDAPTFRNRRDVWKINVANYHGAHFASFPPKLAETCIMAGCPEGGVVLDPFFGSGTTGFVAKQTGRRYIGIEINPEYCRLAQQRIDSA